MNGKLILFAEKPSEYVGLSNKVESSQTVLIVVVDNQAPATLTVSDGKMCKAIEVANIIIAYGGNTVFFVQLINENGINSLALNIQQSLAIDRDYSLNSLVFYPSKNIFIGAHESGELSAWNPSEKGLANIASTKIGTSVSEISISLLKNFFIVLYW